MTTDNDTGQQAGTTDAPNDDNPVAEQYRPVYEYDDDAGPSYSSVGEVVCNVPREPQVDALAAIAGDGPTVPDGWFQGYDYGAPLPVLDGVPIAILESARNIGGGSEGAESWGRYAVDDSLGPVELHHAGAHPENVSKVLVKERKTETDESA
jgi:hypothetical protein